MTGMLGTSQSLLSRIVLGSAPTSLEDPVRSSFLCISQP